MNISILASIGAHNLGDELILKNEIGLLQQEFGLNSSFRIFSYDTTHPFFNAPNIVYKEYFPIASRNPKNIFRNIRNYFSFINTLLWSDIVVIGGGGIFYDHEVQSTKSPLDAWLFRTKIAKLLRKKIYFYGVSIDIKDSENLEKIQEIFTAAHKVTVRDDSSQYLLSKLGLESDVIDDPVMYDNAGEKIKGSSLIKVLESKSFDMNDLSGVDFKGKRVGLALRKGYFSKSGSDQIEIAMIKEILEHITLSGGKITLLPHSFHPTDLQANDYNFLNQFDYPITGSMQETYLYYTDNKLDIVLAQRLHSMILSHIYQIPYIAFNYSKKTHGQLKKLSR